MVGNGSFVKELLWVERHKVKDMLMCHIFPFNEIEKKEKIIIWGMGYVGKQYLEEILQTKYCEVLFAVDQKYQSICIDGVELKSPEYIKKFRDVKIVIALMNYSIANDIRKTLLNWGINEKNIIHRISYILLEDNHSRDINQIASKLDRVQEALITINGLREISMSIESDIRDWRTEGNAQIPVWEMEHYRKIHKLMNVKTVETVPFVRIGNRHDGGYVLLDTFHGMTNSLIAYSFGISNDVSWDKHMALLGYDIFMYDHTIEKLPEENQKFHFFRLGIGYNCCGNIKNLKTLEELMKINKHEKMNGMILKMDVEGAEYGFLNMVNSCILEQFDQIVLELHYLLNTDMTEVISDALTKLNVTHQLVHIHANNFARIRYVNGNIFPDSLEVLYVLKNKFCFKELQDNKNKGDFQDSPCWNTRMETSVNNWNWYTF